jgi:hypothetical protein
MHHRVIEHMGSQDPSTPNRDFHPPCGGEFQSPCGGTFQGSPGTGSGHFMETVRPSAGRLPMSVHCPSPRSFSRSRPSNISRMSRYLCHSGHRGRDYELALNLLTKESGTTGLVPLERLRPLSLDRLGLGIRGTEPA